MAHWVWREPLALSDPHMYTHKVNNSPERLILAADVVMKQLNHGPRPRSNRRRVCFVFLQRQTCLNRLSAYSYTTHTSTLLIDMAIPCHAYFSPQEGPRANYAWINKVPVLLSGVTVRVCMRVRPCVCLSCRTSVYGCRIHKTSPSAPD